MDFKIQLKLFLFESFDFCLLVLTLPSNTIFSYAVLTKLPAEMIAIKSSVLKGFHLTVAL